MVDVNTPLKYHMNDLLYYLGLSTGGPLGKQISYLGAIGAMAKGMLYQYTPESLDDKYKDLKEEYADVQQEIDTFIILVDMLDKAHVPMIDTNPYLFAKARRIRKGVQIAEVLAFHIVTRHNLAAGNIIRARLAEQFGKNRIMHTEDYAELG